MEKTFTGTVCSEFRDNNFAFIKPDDDNGGRDLFFHISAVKPNCGEPHKGQRVRYEIGTNPKNAEKGPCAINVRPAERN